MKIITTNVRLGNAIFKMRRNYTRMVVSVSNFNKVHDLKNAAHCMTEVRRIHRLLSSYESTYYDVIRNNQAQVKIKMARSADQSDGIIRHSI